jgi:phospholipase/carboxylesterase
MTQMLDRVTIEPKTSPKACVIWLHGLGATKHDFTSVIPMLQLPKEHRIRFIFPQAPSQPVSINGGLSMPAWYDIYDMTLGAKEDHDGILKASATIQTLINEQNQQGIATANIVLMGFSQGAALALHCGLNHTQKLAGIAALSGYLPIPHTLPPAHNNPNGTTPILMLHGTNDPILPLTFGEISYQHLQEKGYSVTWKTYNMEHTVTLPQLHDIGRWLCTSLYAKTTSTL